MQKDDDDDDGKKENAAINELPLFRLIHDIINENADKSFANHVGCVMAHRNRPLFSVMNVTAITMHTASGLEKQKAHTLTRMRQFY